MSQNKGDEMIAVLKDQYDMLRLYRSELTTEQLSEIEKIAGQIEYFALEGESFNGYVKGVDQELLRTRLNTNKLIFN